MSEVVIAGAARTPVGAFNGTLSGLSAAELGTVAIAAALERAGISPEDVDEVVLGQVLTASTGMNPARQALLAAGIPDDRTAYLINQVCGSGLRAVAQGFQAIKLGESDIVVAGGQESMSQAPHAAHMRNGTKMGDTKLVDTMIKDGLWCSLMGYHMGNHQNGRHQIGRHHDQGWPVVFADGLPHGQYGRERRREVADHPRRTGRVRRRLAAKGRGGAGGR
jgi:acetyl-CoA C-acetyltransferase